MISLKKLIESNREQLLETALSVYHAAVQAMGASASRACPAVGPQLQEKLTQLTPFLTEEPSCAGLEAAGREIEAEISRWGDASATFYGQRTCEMKEIMLVLAKTAEGMGQRDQRIQAQLREFTGQLESIARLDDLTSVRKSLLRSAVTLRACTESMARESRESVSRLTKEVSQYEAKLQEAERLATTDKLTGLSNRLHAEQVLAERLASGKTFSVILLDLNGFKQINDTHGHHAGDDALRQFAAELKSVFRGGDVVGRWGGDEFLVILNAGTVDIEACVERIRTWAFGDYTLTTPQGPLKTTMSASVGIATRAAGDTATSLVERADAAMYREKQGRRGGPVAVGRQVAGGRGPGAGE